MENKKATILIVDDSKSIRNLLAVTFESAGHSTVKAEDGMDALRFLDGTAYDIIVTDYHMPNMDGLKLISKIRAIEGYKKTPIIFLSTESQRDKIVEAKNLGANGWLIKPFAPERLLEVLNKYIKP